MLRSVWRTLEGRAFWLRLLTWGLVARNYRGGREEVRGASFLEDLEQLSW